MSTGPQPTPTTAPRSGCARRAAPSRYRSGQNNCLCLGPDQASFLTPHSCLSVWRVSCTTWQSSTVDCGPRPCGSEEHCPCVDQLPSPQQVSLGLTIRIAKLSNRKNVIYADNCNTDKVEDGGASTFFIFLSHFYPDLEDCSRFFNCTKGCFTHHQVD